MTSRAYRVGQVLFVLMNKETKIIPVQVVEEIIKRTVDGETTNYVVKMGKSDKILSLSEIDGDVFDNVDKLRDVLTKRVMSTINAVVDNAAVKAGEWYEQPEVHSPILEPLPPSPQQEKNDSESVRVQLPDGKYANVKMPSMI